MILTDMVMPNMSGLEFLEKVKKLLPRSEVAVMTGHGSIETAVQAMKLGAYDYISKPFSPLEELRLFLRRMAEKVHLVEENQFLRERVDTESDLHGIVGSSAKIQDVLRMISRLMKNVSSSPEVGPPPRTKVAIADSMAPRTRGSSRSEASNTFQPKPS